MCICVCANRPCLFLLLPRAFQPHTVNTTHLLKQNSLTDDPLWPISTLGWTLFLLLEFFPLWAAEMLKSWSHTQITDRKKQMCRWHLGKKRGQRDSKGWGESSGDVHWYKLANWPRIKRSIKEREEKRRSDESKQRRAVCHVYGAIHVTGLS